MYHYAISFHDLNVLDPGWQNAVRTAKIKRIELSCSGNATQEQIAKEVRILSGMQKEGSVEVASIHIPFSPFTEWTLSDLNELKRRQGVRKMSIF